MAGGKTSHRHAVSSVQMIARPAFAARLCRKEWGLLALGLAVWVALGCGGAWLVHELRKPRQSCSGNVEPQTTQAQGSTAPGNSFGVLTGQGRCK